jgi:hypothetical protein
MTHYKIKKSFQIGKFQTKRTHCMYTTLLRTLLGVSPQTFASHQRTLTEHK